MQFGGRLVGALARPGIDPASIRSRSTPNRVAIASKNAMRGPVVSSP